MPDKNQSGSPARPPRKTVVTLIHGTFAKGAPWTTDPESKLRKHLERELGAENVQFEIFEWTGSNSDAARLAAADQLREFLQDVFQKHNEARHFLIGHSHGGNVILRALDDGDLAGSDKRISQRIEGAVTLATPFICCERRDTTGVVNKLRYTAIALFTLLVLAVVKMVDGVEETGAVVALVAWLTGTIVLWNKVSPRNSAVTEAVLKKQKEFVRKYNPDAVVQVPFFCASVKRDEAGIGLRVGTMLAESPVLIDRILGWIRFVLWALLVGTIAWWWLKHGFGLEENLGFILTVLFAFLLVVLSVVRLLVAGLRAGFKELVRGMVFGSRGLVMNWLVAFSPKLRPTEAEATNVTVGGPYRVEPKGWWDLNHSAIYESVEILDEVAKWIFQILREPGATAPTGNAQN